MKLKKIYYLLPFLILLAVFFSCSPQIVSEEKQTNDTNTEPVTKIDEKTNPDDTSKYEFKSEEEWEQAPSVYEQPPSFKKKLKDFLGGIKNNISKDDYIYEEKIFKPDVEYINPPTKKISDYGGTGKILELLPGKITYIVPDTMVEKQTYTVVMTLSYGKSDKELTLNIEKQFKNANGENISATTTIENIKLGRDMKATLTSSSDQVKIVSRGSDTKTLTFTVDGAEEKWMWYVTPLSAGVYNLSLNVEVIITKDGVDKPTNLNVFEKRIPILAVPRSFFESVGDFINEHIEWVISTFLLPPFYWAGRKFWKKFRA